MKFINKAFLVGLSVMLPVAACDTDELHNRNKNPQAYLEFPMEYLFTAAELGTASNGSGGDNWYLHGRTNIGYCAYAIQQLSTAGTQGGIFPGDRYTDNVESYNAPWEWLYSDQLKNLAEVIRQTSPDGFDSHKNNLRQAARILRVFNFQRLTDFYGNIPYTQALDGLAGNMLPEYDTQETIYNGMLEELEQATAALTPNTGSEVDAAFGSADLIYNGDTDKWKRMGYSLMLRLAMRISNVAPAKANEYVQKAVAGGVFQSNDDNAWVGMALGPSQWANKNGLSRHYREQNQATTLSKTFIDELMGPDKGSVADDDPRLFVFSQGIAGTGGPITDPLLQKGLPNGLDQRMVNQLEGVPDNPGVNVGATYTRINIDFLQFDDPILLMNYAEAALLLAEASERGIGGLSSATTQSYYEAGVRAAMTMYAPFDDDHVEADPGSGIDLADYDLSVSDAEVDAYLAARPLPAGSEQRLERIGTQIWLAHWTNWYEAWSNWRRSGYPKLTPTNYPGNVTNGTIPARLKYPEQEIATNPNYESGATLPNNVTTKLWWDVVD